MKIKKNAKVRIDYTLKNDQGEVLDSSADSEPLAFLQGHGQIIPGLEDALKGRVAGDAFTVSIEPKKGYGEYDEELAFDIPRDQFEGQDVEVGMQVQATMQDDTVQVFTIRGMNDDKVTLDANHPLAGESLHFDISVVEVSEATQEEIDHGHAH